MKRELEFKVNGNDFKILIEPRLTLLQVLRNELGLTGTKESCNIGECGACTVILDGKALKSCNILAVQANGKEIITIEGLANNGNLHSLQQAFIENGAMQCGFCTPGMIMSAKALLDENPYPTEEEVRIAILGNLCRCTGYNKIVKAILSVRNKE